MNETTHRFLQTIVGRLPEGRIAELRLFPAIRQGGIESAVAVVAVEQPDAPPVAADETVAADAESPDGVAQLELGEVTSETVVDVSPENDGPVELRESASGEMSSSADAGGAASEHAMSAAADDSPYADGDAPIVGDSLDADADSPYADESLGTLAADALVVRSDVIAAELADRATPDPISDALDVEVTRIMADPFNIHTESVWALGDDDAPLLDREAEVGRTIESDDVSLASPGVGLADAELGDDETGVEVDVDDDAADLISATQEHEIPPTAAVSDREVQRDAADRSADAHPRASEGEETIALGDILALPPRAPEQSVTTSLPDPNKRYAILTASYRLVLKGPDRGKWDVDIIHEADAPLATVERVARGVARRAGDESDPEHFSGDELRHVIAQPSWATSA